MKKLIIVACITCLTMSSQANEMTVADTIKYMQDYAKSCSNDAASQATITKFEIIKLQKCSA